MDYLFLLAAALATIHGYTFALWLGKNKNKVGAAGVAVLIVISLALPIYRIIIAQK